MNTDKLFTCCDQAGARLDLAWFRPLAVLLLPVLMLGNAQAALLFYEGFDYPAGEELGQTAITSVRWENDKTQFTVVTGSLNYTGIRPSTGHRLNAASTSPSLDSVRTTRDAWTPQASGTLYVSFLLQVGSTDGIESAGDGTPVLTFGKASNNSHLLGVSLRKTDAIKLGVLKYSPGSAPVSSAFFSSGPGANLSASGSATYLIVAKYEWVDGPTNDVVTVWVNPEGLGAAEDPANKVSTSAGTDGTHSAGRLTLCRGPHLNIDEIRIGKTWAAVTPTRDHTTASSSRELEARPQETN